MTACSIACPHARLIADKRRIHGQRAIAPTRWVCISNCDKITPGMLMAALRNQHPRGVRVRRADGIRQGWTSKASAGRSDLIDAMVAAADDRVSDEEVGVIERSACPTCGSCSGMFTANSMKLPHRGARPVAARQRLGAGDPCRSQGPVSSRAGHLIVDLARRYYETGTTPTCCRATSRTSGRSRTR